jgi:hypothetical protein
VGATSAVGQPSALNPCALRASPRNPGAPPCPPRLQVTEEEARLFADRCG